MSHSYLLDSSVLILLLRQDPKIVQYVTDATATYMSTIALGELFYGAEHSSQVIKGLTEVRQLANRIATLMVDYAAASIYGRLKHEQRMKGLMIPDNDLWIAATAMQYSLTLARRDLHFNRVTGLALE